MELLYMIARGTMALVFCGGTFLFVLRTISECKSIPKYTSKNGFRGLSVVFSLLFFLILAGLGRWYFSGSSGLLLRSKNIFDKRIHYKNMFIHKGNIYDRTAAPESRLAYDVKEEKYSVYNRVYPFGGGAVHLIGYQHLVKGRTGIEKVFSPIISGGSAASAWRWDDLFLNRYYRFIPQGWDIYLTIHAEFQEAVYQSLQGEKGAAVVLDPQNGEVLAMVSVPSYDPNKISSRQEWLSLIQDTVNAPLFNRALFGRYPPGSTFKLVTASAALENGINPVYDLDGKGYIPPGSDRPVFDHEYAEYKRKGLAWNGHGRTSLKKALIKSGNEYFSRLANEVGNRKLYDTAEEFGFNRKGTWNTASEALIREFAYFTGTFPCLEDSNYETGAWCGLGQGMVLASPMQMARISAAIANNGVFLDPVVELGRSGNSGRRVISNSTAKKLREYMRYVVQYGTGKWLNSGNIAAAGKTGTAEVNSGAPHSWFVAFAPYKNPKIAFAVVVENGGWGSGAAVTVAGKIIRSAQKTGLLK